MARKAQEGIADICILPSWDLLDWQRAMSRGNNYEWHAVEWRNGCCFRMAVSPRPQVVLGVTGLCDCSSTTTLLCLHCAAYWSGVRPYLSVPSGQTSPHPNSFFTAPSCPFQVVYNDSNTLMAARSQPNDNWGSVGNGAKHGEKHVGGGSGMWWW